MPKYSTIFTRELSGKLADCQIQMNRIHECLGHTQGYGHVIPSSTIDTWRIVKARLDHLYDWCYQAKMSFEKINPSSDVARAIWRLEKALQWGESQIASVDDVFNAPGNLSSPTSGDAGRDDEKSHEEKRWSRVVRSEFGHWKPSPQAEAYRAICVLQEHTTKKGGSTANGFGEVLSDDDLWARDKVFENHMKQVTTSVWSAVGP